MEHFSKYGLVDDDDDEEVVVETKQNANANSGLLSLVIEKTVLAEKENKLPSAKIPYSTKSESINKNVSEMRERAKGRS